MAVVFVTASGAWTVPSDCRSAQIECYGPGANGAVGPSSPGGTSANGGDGGGGGAYSRTNVVTLTPGAILNHAVPTGGTGLQTIFNTALNSCVAAGGSGINGGSIGSSIGDAIVAGLNGSAGGAFSANGGPGGNGGGAGAGANAGGASAGGAGATNASPAGVGAAGNAYGGGGGGGGGGCRVGFLAGGAGGGGYQGLIAVTYTPYVLQPPTVTTISPAKGNPSGGDTITVTGTNFTGGSISTLSVKFGAVNAASFTVLNATTLTCVTPAQPGGTSTNIIVATTDGTSSTGAGNAFLFASAPGGNMPMMGF